MKRTSPALAGSSERGFELLCLAARPNRSADDRVRAQRLLEDGVDWTRFVHLAKRNYVVPVVYRSLSGMCLSAVPQQAERELRSLAELAARRGLFISAELRRVLGLFENRNLNAIAYKGPVLALQAYGNVCDRDYFDVDVIVSRADFARARSCLLDYGYRPEYEDGPFRRWLRTRREGEQNFIRFPGPPVELHWKLTPTYIRMPLRLDAVWSRREHVRFGERQVATLSIPDLIISLCVHNGGKHFWSALRWISDLSAIIESRQDNIEWPYLFSSAARMGCSRLLYTGIILAQRLMNAPIPDKWLAVAFADDNSLSVAGKIITRLSAGAADEKWDNTVRRSLTYFELRERVWDRICYAPHALSRLFLRRRGVPGTVVARPFLRIPSLIRKYRGLMLERKTSERSNSNGKA